MPKRKKTKKIPRHKKTVKRKSSAVRKRGKSLKSRPVKKRKKKIVKSRRAPKAAKKKKVLRPQKAAKNKKILPAKKTGKSKSGKHSEDDEVIKEPKKILTPGFIEKAESAYRAPENDEEGFELEVKETPSSAAATPMQIYLKQIEKIPLLTPEQEIDYGRKVKNNGRDAPEARKRMIQSNLRLVISIAKRYANMGLPFSDLIEEGNIGLMRAVDKFNYKRGYRFSTYASWWIKQAIMRSLSNQGKTIRIPVYMYDLISKWRKVRDHLMQKFDRIPTRKEISDVMKVPMSKIKDIESLVTRPSSLNMPLSIDGTAELIDVIQDEVTEGQAQIVDEGFKSERIDGLLHNLDERERQILIFRFGLKGNDDATLEEVAKKFGITRERVRQIEHAALAKIRTRVTQEEDRLEDYLK